MPHLALFLHLAAAIVWMGGMVFMVLALRPAAHSQLQPPLRLRLMREVLHRFFVLVGGSIAVLLVTGGLLMMRAGGALPPGWIAMAALGALMMLIFGHIVFVPYRRLKAAVAAEQWPVGGQQMAQITLFAKINLALGWIAIAAVMLWR